MNLRDNEVDLAPWLDDRLPRIIGLQAALARGLSYDAIERRVHAGRWHRVLPRTYLTRDTFTDLDRTIAALTFAGRGAALSGAAALWSVGVKRVALPRELLVIVPPENCTASTRWVRVRRSVRPLIHQLAPGPRCVDLARATTDLAVTMRRLDDVRTVVARVVEHHHCTVDELGAALAEGPVRGSKHLRQALAEVGHGAASAPEAEAVRILRATGIEGWEPNYPVTLPDGSERVFDFYWPRLRAVLEIDSVEWHYELDDWASTWDRHFDLAKFGYSVVHRPPSALRHEHAFVAGVRRWLGGREADLRHGLGGA